MDSTDRVRELESKLYLDIRYKVLWIGEIAKHKGIAKSKVLQGKKQFSHHNHKLSQ